MEDVTREAFVPEDWDDFVEFINSHRGEIAEGSYDLRIERDWARDLSDSDLLLLVTHCPSSRLTIATATKCVEVLELLSSDSSPDVREAVADNLRTPKATLDRLADDPVPAVRMAVAENVNVSPQKLEGLATDAVDYVRWGVAHNEKTSPDVLGVLVRDPDSYVADEAKRNPAAPKRGLLKRLFRSG